MMDNEKWKPKTLEELCVDASPTINLNLCHSLIPKETVAISFGLSLEYEKLINLFVTNMEQRTENKDGLAFNLNEFKPITPEVLNRELLLKCKKIYEKESSRKRYVDEQFKKIGKNLEFVSIRRKKYIGSFNSVVLDFDNAQAPYIRPETVRNLLPGDMSYIMHNTYSSSLERPKFRAIIPLAKPENSCYYWMLFSPLLRVIDPDGVHINQGRIDPTCAQEWRFFYFPNFRVGSENSVIGEISEQDDPWIITNRGKFYDGYAAQMESRFYNLQKLKHFRGKKNG